LPLLKYASDTSSSSSMALVKSAIASWNMDKQAWHRPLATNYFAVGSSSRSITASRSMRAS
jgi:hypothetical protein